MQEEHAPLVRRAAGTDIPMLLPLIEDYWRFERIDGFDAARVATELDRLLGDARLGAAWLAVAGNAPAAYLLAVYVFSLEHLGLTAEVDEFFVRPDFRGRGIGDRMLGIAEQEFTAAGCTNVALQLGHDNDSGRRFYLRHGYAPRSGFELLDKMLPTGPVRRSGRGWRGPR